MMKSNSGDTSLATRNLPTAHAQSLPSSFVLLPTTPPTVLPQGCYRAAQPSHGFLTLVSAAKGRGTA